MPARTTTTCKTCGKTITPRTADVKRGWGKFCSKSCSKCKLKDKKK